MGERRTRKPARKCGARQNFFANASSTPLSASHLITLGYNRYDAWMMVLRLSPMTVARRMDLSGYIARLPWPESIERPKAVEYLEMVRAGKLPVNAEFVDRFCKAIGQTPEVLVSPSASQPAPAEIVEAAMKRVERFAFDHEPVPAGLWSFIVTEVQKGEALGQLCWSRSNALTYGSMMANMESFYDDVVGTAPETFCDRSLLMRQAGAKLTIGGLRDRFVRVVSYYADYMALAVEQKNIPRKGLDGYLEWRGSDSVRAFMKGWSNMIYLREKLESVGLGEHIPQLRMKA